MASACVLSFSLLLAFILSAHFNSAFATGRPHMVFVEVGDQGYGMIYDITNASITDFGTDEKQKTLMVEIRATAPGKFGIEVVRAIMDSKDEANMDDNADIPFVITLYEKSTTGTNTTKTTIVTANETFTNDSYRRLEIDFSENTFMITIQGTTLIPEFGQVATFAAAIFIGSMVCAARLRK